MDGDSDNRQTERTPQKCFKCGSEDPLIAKFLKPPKDNEKRRKQVRFNEKVNCAFDNGKNKSDQNIYGSMARMSGNDKYPSENFGDSWQLTNCIFDSAATCHVRQQTNRTYASKKNYMWI